MNILRSILHSVARLFEEIDIYRGEEPRIWWQRKALFATGVALVWFSSLVLF